MPLPTSFDKLIELPARKASKPTSRTGPVRAQRIPIADDRRTIVTLHHHEVIIRRKDPLYKAVSILESVFLVTSSLSLVAVSGATIVWAAATVGVI